MFAEVITLASGGRTWTPHWSSSASGWASPGALRYTGELPGLEELTHRARDPGPGDDAGQPDTTQLGPGKIKLVQAAGGRRRTAHAGRLLRRGRHLRGLRARAGRPAVHQRLLEQGCKELMEPISATVPPFDSTSTSPTSPTPATARSRSSSGRGIWQALPGEPRLEGVNHVAFGVSDMAATREFYADFGFTHPLCWNPTATSSRCGPGTTGRCRASTWSWCCRPRAPGSSRSGCIRRRIDCRGEWGHLGPMEFAIGVSNLDRLRPAPRIRPGIPPRPADRRRRNRGVAVRLLHRPGRPVRLTGRTALLTVPLRRNSHARLPVPPGRLRRAAGSGRHRPASCPSRPTWST